MIAYLEGKILNKGKDFLIIKTGGIGYKVFVNTALISEFDIGQEAELFIYHHITEQSSLLFGLKNPEEQEFFEMILSVSGIGPKTALNVLAAASIYEIKDSISRGEPDLLNKVSGIGPKTAERVVLELRNKIGHIEMSANSKNATGGFASGDEIDALISLGYSMTQARDALRSIDKDIKDSGERIKEALKKIG
ncbi:MAG: Holliday junction branch migration protein RuvA [Patescibacteria group bacterium]|jgi:Holliday junction DNA helicase RuvA|nr:Holliday junction branch migration protein RuvA [Patescibacteria group bacterium]